MPVKITYLLPNIESGGTERHVLTLARRLDRSRFSPSLVTTAGGGSLYPDFAAVMPVTVHGGDPTRSKRFRSSPREHFRTIRFLAREFRRTRPDIVHAYLPSSNVLGPIAAKLAGVRRVIISKRGLADYKTLYFLPRLVEPLGNLLADLILVNSDAVRREVERTERRWEGKFRRIYNGVAPLAPWPPGEAERFRAREGIPLRGPMAVCVSNFFRYKGHGDLVEAASRVARDLPTLTFVLIGREAGSLEETRARARELGVLDRFRFTGLRSDVPDFLRAADLFVHPSHQEGFSNAILEGMAAGLPVVACAVGGNPEAVVDGETGRLVPPRDPNRLAAAILEIAGDPDRGKRYGEAGRQRAQERFSLLRMVAEFEEMYETLTAREGGPD